MPCRASQDGHTMESSHKMWSTGGENGKPLLYSCLESLMNSMKEQAYITPEKEPPRSEDVQYFIGKVLVAQSCPSGLYPTRLFCPRNSPGKIIQVRCRFLLQGIFLIQGSNPGLQHCKQIPYHLSHQGRTEGNY